MGKTQGHRTKHRVLIAVESPAFAIGLWHILRAGHCAVVFSTVDTDALHIAKFRPHVALVDADLPDRSGWSFGSNLIAEIPGTAVILLSRFDWDVSLAEAFNAGAAGFLMKNIGSAELASAVMEAAQGHLLFTSQQLLRIRDWEQTCGKKLNSLSIRERQVLRLLQAGQGNREIAEALVITRNTVEKHVSAVMAKLQSRSRAELVSLLFQHHINLI